MKDEYRMCMKTLLFTGTPNNVREAVAVCLIPWLQDLFPINLLRQKRHLKQYISLYSQSAHIQNREKRERTIRLPVRVTMTVWPLVHGRTWGQTFQQSDANMNNKGKTRGRSYSDSGAQVPLYVRLPFKDVVILEVLEPRYEIIKFEGSLMAKLLHTRKICLMLSHIISPQLEHALMFMWPIISETAMRYAVKN